MFQRKQRRMATLIPVLPARVIPVQPARQPDRPPGYREFCWACAILETAWIALLAAAIYWII